MAEEVIQALLDKIKPLEIKKFHNAIRSDSKVFQMRAIAEKIENYLMMQAQKEFEKLNEEL